jgi:hypothetical protein
MKVACKPTLVVGKLMAKYAKCDYGSERQLLSFPDTHNLTAYIDFPPVVGWNKLCSIIATVHPKRQVPVVSYMTGRLVGLVSNKDSSHCLFNVRTRKICRLYGYVGFLDAQG